MSEGQLRLNKVREARLRWYEHMQRRHSEYTEQKVLKVELGDHRESGWVGVEKEDVQRVGVTEGDSRDRVRLR